MPQSGSTLARKSVKRRRDEAISSLYDSLGSGAFPGPALPGSLTSQFASSQATILQHRKNRPDVSSGSVANIPRW